MYKTIFSENNFNVILDVCYAYIVAYINIIYIKYTCISVVGTYRVTQRALRIVVVEQIFFSAGSRGGIHAKRSDLSRWRRHRRRQRWRSVINEHVQKPCRYDSKEWSRNRVKMCAQFSIIYRFSRHYVEQQSERPRNVFSTCLV